MRARPFDFPETNHLCPHISSRSIRRQSVRRYRRSAASCWDTIQNRYRVTLVAVRETFGGLGCTYSATPPRPDRSGSTSKGDRQLSTPRLGSASGLGLDQDLN